MHRAPWFKLTAALTSVALVVSCAPTRIPSISDSGAAFQPARDERRLWEMSRNEEKKLREKITVYQDPLLVDYLDEVVGRLNPPGMSANRELAYRITVLEDPTLNAFAYPHGSLYVHTGLLARMENEDQLATVLGHEMTHVENRHMLRYRRAARNKQIGFSIAAIAAAVIVADERGKQVQQGDYREAARIGVLSDILVGLGLTLAILASVNGYGRDLEREADAGGFDKMTRAGYDTREAARVYEILKDDHGESGKMETFFFGNHPRLGERIESAREWQNNEPDAPAAERPYDPETFTRRIRPVIRDDARLNIEAGRLKLAEAQLRRVLAMMPADPETHLLLGRLALKKADSEKNPRAQRQLRRDAMDSFREAVRLDPDRPAPHRELGLLAYREGDPATACVEFRQYVELDPKAPDAGRIRDYVLELERDGHCR